MIDKTIFLNAGYVEPPLSLIFGELLKLATDPNEDNHLQHYHSDFFYDAIWLKETWVKNEYSFNFFFSFDNCGTSISTTADNSHRNRKFYISVIFGDDTAKPSRKLIVENGVTVEKVPDKIAYKMNIREYVKEVANT